MIYVSDGISIILECDGSSSSVDIDVSLAPFNKNLSGRVISSVVSTSTTDSGNHNIAISGSAVGSVITLNFSPVPVSGTLSFGFSWLY